MGMILTACATMPVPMAMSVVVIIAVIVAVVVVVACWGHRRFLGCRWWWIRSSIRMAARRRWNGPVCKPDPVIATASRRHDRRSSI